MKNVPGSQFLALIVEDLSRVDYYISKIVQVSNILQPIYCSKLLKYIKIGNDLRHSTARPTQTNILPKKTIGHQLPILIVHPILNPEGSRGQTDTKANSLRDDQDSNPQSEGLLALEASS